MNNRGAAINYQRLWQLFLEIYKYAERGMEYGEYASGPGRGR